MEIAADLERRDLVMAKLLKAFRAKEFPYNLPKAVQPHIPEYLPKNLRFGSVEHGCFLFCLCYYMKGIDSITAVKQMAKMYEACPKIFVPSVGMNISPVEITKILEKFRFRFKAGENGKFWADNFKFLVKHWGGNPLNLLDGVETYDEACLRIRNKGKMGEKHFEDKFAGFYGFQFKMVSMLCHFFVDSGLSKPFLFPPPVDFHVLRILLANEVIRIVCRNGNPGYYKKITDLAREILVDYSIKNGVSPIELCNTMWFLSRLLCIRNQGNSSHIGKNEGRKTHVRAKEVVWSLSQQKIYMATCGSCPIMATCKFNIPNANYQRLGLITLRGERRGPPQRSFSFEK